MVKTYWHYVVLHNSTLNSWHRELIALFLLIFYNVYIIICTPLSTSFLGDNTPPKKTVLGAQLENVFRSKTQHSFFRKYTLLSRRNPIAL